jgi:hypothetical protein
MFRNTGRLLHLIGFLHAVRCSKIDNYLMIMSYLDFFFSNEDVYRSIDTSGKIDMNLLICYEPNNLPEMQS